MIFMLMTANLKALDCETTNLKTINNNFLKRISYIFYLISSTKSDLKDLIDSKSKSNAMMLALRIILAFITINRNVGAQQIDCSYLKTCDLVLARFCLQNSLQSNWFFKKALILSEINIEMVLAMSFIVLSKANVPFNANKLTKKNYTIIKAMSISRYVELIDKRKFV